MRSDEELKQAIESADIPVLLMVLVHLTGDRRWIEPPFTPKRNTKLFGDETGGLSEESQAEVRAASIEVLRNASPSDPGVHLDDATLSAMMSACVGENVSSEYVPVLLQEMGLRRAPDVALPDVPKDFRAVIIGAGVSGVCAAIRFQALGILYVALEKSSSVGGTWYENQYPDAGVDTPNHFYSFSFAPSAEWTSYFSKQPEILRYVQDTVARFGVAKNIRLGVTVNETAYDDATQRWRTTVTNSDGTTETLVSEVLVTAVGALNTPKRPDIPGIDSYRGEMFHTAQWKKDVDFTGKRVALVGAGASAMQTARTVALAADHLTIFQRSPQWVMPNADYHRKVSPERQWLFRNVPFYGSWYRFGLFWRYADGIHPSLIVDPAWPHPERAVGERNDKHRLYMTKYLADNLEGRPDLFEKSLPHYPPFGKRMLADNYWFETIKRPDVALVTEGISHIDETAIITTDGVRHEVDTIILATGFHSTRMMWPLQVRGRGGISIHDEWREDDAHAYLGITAPGFPNMFMLLGPNTGLAHGGSIIFNTEVQVAYIVKCIALMLREHVGALEVRRDVCDAYNEKVDTAHANMVWTHPGMSNWYRNRAGRIVALSPWRSVDYWQMTKEPNPADFVREPRQNS